MAAEPDAFGTALKAEYDHGGAYEIVEREDGHIDATPASLYFRTYEDWSALERTAIEHVEGRVLDVGCGAGRHALYLQEQGYDVVGLDLSSGALEVARARGLQRTLQRDVAALTEEEGPFDTVCMFGNNFGLVGTREHAPAVLDAIDRVTEPDARILAVSANPYETDEEAHLDYHRQNEDRDRLPGALRLRIRYKRAASDWFDYLLAAPAEMRSIVTDAGWTLTDTIDADAGPAYVGIVAKDGSA